MHVLDSEVLIRVSALQDENLVVSVVLCSKYGLGTCILQVTVDLDNLASLRVNEPQGDRSADMALTGFRILDHICAALLSWAFTFAGVWVLEVRCAARIGVALTLADLRVEHVCSRVAFVRRALVLVVIKFRAFTDRPV